MALFHEVADPRGYAWIQVKLGEVARDQGDYPTAQRWLESALMSFTRQHDESGYVWAATGLGMVELAHGDAKRAVQFFSKSLTQFHTLGHKVGVAYCLKGLADVLVRQQRDTEQAVQLFSAAAALLAEIGAGITPGDRVECDPHLQTARTQLNSMAFAKAWATGQALTIKQALVLARESQSLILN
jgi:tetratricopeptide (TPR) repeat protein